jgi:hypothetical protein
VAAREAAEEVEVILEDPVAVDLEGLQSHQHRGILEKSPSLPKGSRAVMMGMMMTTIRPLLPTQTPATVMPSTDFWRRSSSQRKREQRKLTQSSFQQFLKLPSSSKPGGPKHGTSSPLQVAGGIAGSNGL